MYYTSSFHRSSYRLLLTSEFTDGIFMLTGDADTVADHYTCGTRWWRGTKQGQRTRGDVSANLGSAPRPTWLTPRQSSKGIPPTRLSSNTTASICDMGKEEDVVSDDYQYQWTPQSDMTIQDFLAKVRPTRACAPDHRIVHTKCPMPVQAVYGTG